MITFLFFISLLFCQNTPNTHIDGVVAIVGNNVVLKSDVLEQSFMLAKQKNINPQTSPGLFEKVFLSVLDEKINRLVVLAAAANDSLVSVSYEEINATLDERIDGFVSIFGSKEALEDTMGMKINEIKAEYWKTVEEELLVERFRYFRFNDVSVNKQEVVSFFNNNPDSFPVPPALIDFSILEKRVTVSKNTKDSLFLFLKNIKDSVLTGSLSFDIAAEKYSQDPGSKNKGGNLGFTKRGSLLPVYERAAFLLDVGEVSDPIESVFGFHLIKLLDRVGEKIKTQHILLSLNADNLDLARTTNDVKELLNVYFYDPGGFDSLCVVNQKEERNFSGYYKDFDISVLPIDIQQNISSLNDFSFSDVFVRENSVFVIYKHKEQKKSPLTLKNNWPEIETFALNHKRYELFSNWVEETKKTIYVKTFSY